MCEHEPTKAMWAVDEKPVDGRARQADEVMKGEDRDGVEEQEGEIDGRFVSP